MSNHFSLRCVDHQVDHDDRYLSNWGYEVLWAWIDSADLVTELIMNLDDDFLNISSSSFRGSVNDFLREHRECQIVPISEYGDVCQGPNRRLLDAARIMAGESPAGRALKMLLTETDLVGG